MQKIIENLPGFNCGACGFARCDIFAEKLLNHEALLEDCVFLKQARYTRNRENIEAELKSGLTYCVKATLSGVIDSYEADFLLKPLNGEHSCREILCKFSTVEVQEGEIIRYRPLGCPVTHFAMVIEKNHGLLKVGIVGPVHRLGQDFDYKEVGICMVLGFEGVVEGKLPSVGETVRFLPGECMMQKVHSGVVVSCEGRKVLIESVDLKVWSPPVKR